MATQLALDDDIFARPPRALARRLAQTARITCRVCDMKDTVPLDHPVGPLCRECAMDIPATRAKVKIWLDGVLAQMDVVLDRWADIQMSYPAFWAKIEDAKEKAGDDTAALTDALRRAYAAHPTYAKLLDAEAEMLHAMQPLEIERKRLELALEAL